MEKESVTVLGEALEPMAMTVMACRAALETRWGSLGKPEKETLYPVVLKAPFDYLPEAIEGFIPVSEDIRQCLKHLDFDRTMEVVGVSELFVFIRKQRVYPAGEMPERVMFISEVQRADVEEYPNFVPVASYQSREPRPMEIGYLAKHVTYMFGIGHSHGRGFGPVLCRVEMAEEEVPA